MTEAHAMQVPPEMQILAVQTATFVAHHVMSEAGQQVGKAAVDKARQTAMNLIGWLREKLTGTRAQTLDDVVSEPNNSVNVEMLALQLQKEFMGDAGFFDELQKRMAQISPATINIQKVRNQGSDNTIIQVGPNSSANIR